jgi:uncharacterized protein YecE (DUF72 family)
MAGTIRVGVGGWTYPAWRGTFFPKGLAQKRELEYAATRLTTIEINGTFYRTQKPETFAKWREETPEGFVFALKAPRYATNRRVLAEAGESIGWFVASGIGELGDRLGPINWQLADTKAFDPEDMEAFLDLLPDRAGERRLRHAIEVRHPSFEDPRFKEMARARGVAVILAGDSRYPEIEAPAEDLAYVRIMGTARAHPAGYTEDALDAWAARARAWAVPGRDVFLYVISGEKAKNPAAARALIERL